MAHFNPLTGYRFHPNDKDIITKFLEKKMRNRSNNFDMIRELNICNYEPSELPGLSPAPNDQEWYFLNPISNDGNIRRTTNTGYWKVTGDPQVIKDDRGREIGYKRILTYHIGRSPNGRGTSWIIHEFHSVNETAFQDRFVLCRLKNRASG